MVKPIKKFVVIGPESTGKSTLCEKLASHFSATYSKEYAREYLLEHGMAYSTDDLLLIAKGQIELENKAIDIIKCDSAINPILFIDTDMYVMKVWSEFVFNTCHLWILNQIDERKYDGYLLCKPDLPWVKDELREYPDSETRDKLYHYYKDILINQSVPWYEVAGSDPNRTQGAIEWVNQFIYTT
jgi:NadR type nicotinamide-nucleotide adenylyltransferase